MSGRIRTVKPEWLEDELMASLSDEARVLSIALILMADDHGLGRASIASVASGAWRYEMERDDGALARETLAKASRALRELHEIGFVVFYEVSRQRYFAIRNWKKHQKVDRPGKPRVPVPDDLDSLMNQPIAKTSRDPREEFPQSRDTLATDLRSPISDLRSPTWSADPARAREGDPSPTDYADEHTLKSQVTSSPDQEPERVIDEPAIAPIAEPPPTTPIRNLDPRREPPPSVEEEVWGGTLGPRTPEERHRALATAKFLSDEFGRRYEQARALPWMGIQGGTPIALILAFHRTADEHSVSVEELITDALDRWFADPYHTKKIPGQSGINRYSWKLCRSQLLDFVVLPSDRPENIRTEGPDFLLRDMP